jgi:hypothetical protein
MNRKKAIAVAATAGIAGTMLFVNPAQANTRDVLQQLPMPASGSCADVAAPTTLNWSGVPSGSWTRQWAAWINPPQGGVVCSRTLFYNNSTRRWAVR